MWTEENGVWLHWDPGLLGSWMTPRYRTGIAALGSVLRLPLPTSMNLASREARAAGEWVETSSLPQHLVKNLSPGAPPLLRARRRAWLWAKRDSRGTQSPGREESSWPSCPPGRSVLF